MHNDHGDATHQWREIKFGKESASFGEGGRHAFTFCWSHVQLSQQCAKLLLKWMVCGNEGTVYTHTVWSLNAHSRSYVKLRCF